MKKPHTHPIMEALASEIEPIVPQETFQNQAPCLACGHVGINIVQMPKYSKHYAARRCGYCDAFRGWQPKPSTEQRRAELRRAIAQLLESPLLSDWDRGFLESIRSQKKLSLNQEACLNRLEGKVKPSLDE